MRLRELKEYASSQAARTDAVRTAYSFFHQKLQVYRYSDMDWQKEDIEYAVSEYVSAMSPQLLSELSEGNPDYLIFHPRFAADLEDAVAKMERIL